MKERIQNVELPASLFVCSSFLILKPPWGVGGKKHGGLSFSSFSFFLRGVLNKVKALHQPFG
jgi:hypothetical protein